MNTNMRDKLRGSLEQLCSQNSLADHPDQVSQPTVHVTQPQPQGAARLAFADSDGEEKYVCVKTKKPNHGVRHTTPPHSTSVRLTVSLIMIMSCFVLATPLSLLCTLPAYVMADKADMCKQRGEMEQERYYHRCCCTLHCAAVLLGVICIAMFLFAFVYIAVKP